MNVRLEIFGLLHVFERRIDVRTVLGESLNKFFRADKRQPFELDECELLAQQRRAGTHFHRIRLKSHYEKEHYSAFIVNNARNNKLNCDDSMYAKTTGDEYNKGTSLMIKKNQIFWKSKRKTKRRPDVDYPIVLLLQCCRTYLLYYIIIKDHRSIQLYTICKPLMV